MGDISPDLFRKAMRRLASSVSVITTNSDGELSGMTATAVCSVSAEPPQLLICVNRQARSNSLIAKAGFFCVNILSAGQAETAGRFASTDPATRFAGIDVVTLKTGAPALANAVVSFDCSVEQAIESGSHTIYIGRIVSVRISDNNQPLIYSEGRYSTVADATNNAATGNDAFASSP